MKKKKYLWGSGTIGFFMLLVLAFNTFVYPNLLNKSIDHGDLTSYALTEGFSLPDFTIKLETKEESLISTESGKVSWTEAISIQDSKEMPVKRISESKEEYVALDSLNKEVADTLLSVEQLIEIIKSHVFNVKSVNSLVYKIQLTKTESPNIPYRYNVILGEENRIKELYEDPKPFAQYYEMGSDYIAIKGKISLGAANFIQVNAVTGDILIHISAGMLKEQPSKQ